jgi:hypothetical protein
MYRAFCRIVLYLSNIRTVMCCVFFGHISECLICYENVFSLQLFIFSTYLEKSDWTQTFLLIEFFVFGVIYFINDFLLHKKILLTYSEMYIFLYLGQCIYFYLYIYIYIYIKPFCDLHNDGYMY